jgi:hypothetical protein
MATVLSSAMTKNVLIYLWCFSESGYYGLRDLHCMKGFLETDQAGLDNPAHITVEAVFGDRSGGSGQLPAHAVEAREGFSKNLLFPF